MNRSLAPWGVVLLFSLVSDGLRVRLLTCGGAPNLEDPERRCASGGSGVVACLRVVVVEEQVTNAPHLVIGCHAAVVGDTPDRADQSEQFGDAVQRGRVVEWGSRSIPPVRVSIEAPSRCSNTGRGRCYALSHSKEAEYLSGTWFLVAHSERSRTNQVTVPPTLLRDLHLCRSAQRFASCRF